MSDEARYSRIGDILRIIVAMMGKIQGVSLKDIMEECHASRRTAERIRDCLILEIPQIEEIENPHSREKRWGFNNSYMKDLIVFSPEEIANLESIKKYEHESGTEDKEKLLEETINKLKALSRKKYYKFDNVIELLMQTEGYAIKQSPKYKFDLDMLQTIREAMKDNRKIKGKYNGKDKLLAPYGLIYGSKVYLVAVEEDKGTNPYCYLLHKFSDVKKTFDEFDKGDFNLDEFSKKSFGVYQGEAIDVKLLFSASAANEVLNYHFHSTQKMKQNEDGTVTVKFKASGEYEIMWHLFRWGCDVKILAPTSLKKQYIELLEKTMKHQKEK